MRTTKCLRYILIPVCAVILLGIVAAVCFLPNDLLFSSKTDVLYCLGGYDVTTHTVAMYRKDVAVPLSDQQQAAWLTALNGQPINTEHTYAKHVFDIRRTLLCDLRIEITNRTDNETFVVYIDSNSEKGYYTDTFPHENVYYGFRLKDEILPLL